MDALQREGGHFVDVVVALICALSVFRSLFLEEGIEEASKLLLGALDGPLGPEPRLQLLDLSKLTKQRSVLGPHLSHALSLSLYLSVCSNSFVHRCAMRLLRLNSGDSGFAHQCKCLTSALQAASRSLVCFLILPLVFSCFSLISLRKSITFNECRNRESDCRKSTRGGHEERG